jgi:hypothetical protein
MQKAATPVQVILPGGAHYQVVPWHLSIRTHANNLQRVGYIVTVYHLFPPDVEPSSNKIIVT